MDMPLPRRPHVASLDEVRITRDGDAAIIEYADSRIATTRFVVGREAVDALSDQEILDRLNAGIEATDELVRQDYILTEVPVGSPQVDYHERSDQWAPRGTVLRGELMGYDEHDPAEAFVSVDGRDFTLHEFAKMLSTFDGWGFRLSFVPQEEIHVHHELEVREPDEE